MRFKLIYSTFQSISVQTHQDLMLINFNFAKILKHPGRPLRAAFACSTVIRLRAKTSFVRTGHGHLYLLNPCHPSFLNTPLHPPRRPLVPAESVSSFVPQHPPAPSPPSSHYRPTSPIRSISCHQTVKHTHGVNASG